MKLKVYYSFLLLILLALPCKGLDEPKTIHVLTFALTNEKEDRLIERLVSAGCTNLYDALVYLRKNLAVNSPYALTSNMDILLDSLKKLNSKGDVFTKPLSTFGGYGKTPVGICADGTVCIKKFSVYDYIGELWFIEYFCLENYTFTTNPNHYILMKDSIDKNQNSILYVAFGIAWGGVVNSVTDMSKQRTLKVYPNPATEYIEITQPSEELEPSEGTDFRIYNALGECVMAERLDPEASVQRINIEQLSSGQYFLKCDNFISRLIVVK